MQAKEEGVRKSAATSSWLVVAMWIFGNVSLSVSLVTINKIIMVKYGFPFVLSLTFFHFLATTIFMEFVTRLGCFSSSVLYMPLRDNVVTAAAGVASIAFMNLSLQANSVGFYQITKLCGIPVIILIEYFSAGKTHSRKIYLALSILLFGVGLATVTDVELNTKGLILAAIAVVSTAQFQSWQGSKQKQYGLSPIQCTHTVALPQCLITLLFASVVEKDVLQHRFHETGMDVALVLASCLIAMVMNVTTFGLIGKTSAVTFQVVGHAKTCLILSAGFIFFPPSEASLPQLLKNITGLAVAVAGMVLYGHLRDVEGRNRAGEVEMDCLDRFAMAIGLRRYVGVPAADPDAGGRRSSDNIELAVPEPSAK